MPNIQPAVTAGIGVSFVQSGGAVYVSSVRETSAANFGGVLPMDQLCRIDHKQVESVYDVSRILGPYGSVVHLEISRPSAATYTETRVTLVREIMASKRASEEYAMSLETSGSVTTSILRNHCQMTAGRVAAGSAGSEDEARKLVTQPTVLEMNQTTPSPNENSFVDHRWFAKAKKPWRRVRAHVTTGGLLVIDRTVTGIAILFATHSPEATSDLQELQHLIFSKSERAKDALEASRCFQVHLSTGVRGQAFSQRGLLEVDFTQMIEFRAQSAIEASTWVRGINALLSHFALPFGTRPAFVDAGQMRHGQARHGPPQLSSSSLASRCDRSIHTLASIGSLRPDVSQRPDRTPAYETRKPSARGHEQARCAGPPRYGWLTSQQVLIELGFTEHQVASAREALQREAHEHLPASMINTVSLHDDLTVLQWLVNNETQPQQQADAMLGFAQGAKCVS